MAKHSRTGRWAVIVALAAVAAWAVDENFSADPNDPLFPQTANSQGCSVPGSPTCIDPPGQWDMYSYSPTVPPTDHPSGISADLAWRTTIGRSDVEAVVFDTGVNYDHEDLRNQIWLNRGELPVPDGVACAAPPGDPYDCNADGLFNVQDYLGDSRITDELLPGVLSRSDLRVFEDGTDGDGNGYVDDISGFDFDDVDGDEYDHRDFGHGTGRNGVLAAQANNGTGIAGMCSNCRITNARIEDTYVVVRAETTANAVIWAADHGFEVINMSLGHVGASSMSRKAFEYAYSRNVLPFSAIANEFHFHQGYVGLYDEVFAVGALAYAGPTTAGIAPNNGQPSQAPTTYLRKANYSNYGAHLDVVAPSDTLTTTQGGGYADSTGTSSATPHVVGTAALVYSRARNLIEAGKLDTAGLALADISNQEVRQVINQTADDIGPDDDPALGTYPVSAGWDKWTGYGRVNADAAVHSLMDAGLTQNRIPPEADINSPDWYSYVTGVVPVEFYANNRWRASYDWVLEVGAGVEPTTFTEIQAGTGAAADKALASTSLANNHSIAWDTADLADGGYTLRLRVWDAADSTIRGEDRMFVWVRRGLVHADNHPGFPIRVTRAFGGEDIPISAESMSNALVDLDGDNTLEIVLTTADGEVRAYRQDGALLPGFPVMTEPLAGLPGAASPAFDGNLANGEVPVTGAFIIGGVAVGDIDRDGVQEICAGAVNGKLYCWNADGSVQAGFPVAGDVPKHYDPYTAAPTDVDLPQAEAFVAPPTLGNLDGDAEGTLEIAAASRDQKLYAWKADGTRLAGFPIALGSISPKATVGTISGVLIADIDADGANDILVATNEVSGSLPNTAGRIYAFDAGGAAKPGWPVQPSSPSGNGVPIVAQGVVNGPLAANFVAGDAQLEIVGHAFLGDAILYNHDGSQVRALAGSHNGAGVPPDTLEDTPTGGPARADDAPVHTYVGLGAIADFNGTLPGLEYLVGTVGNNLVVDVGAGSGQVTNFDHYFSAWNAGSGSHVPNFPRIVDGWQFITGPAVADLDNAAGSEAIVPSSGLFVHAFNGGNGANIGGWPKFTGHWAVATPSIGDLDDDGDIEVVLSDRLGYVHVWSTPGEACKGDVANAQWRKYRHDEWNSGNFGSDTLRPSRVADLTGSRAGLAVSLSWTAVGDDARCGTAALYEVIVSDAPVTDFDDPALTRISVTPPAASGEPMGFGESEATARYYTLRVEDESGNRSPLASVLVPAAPAVGGTGVAEVTEAFSPTAGPGGLVLIGSFTLTHATTADESHRVSQVTLALGDPGVFDTLLLSGPGGRTAAVTAPGGSATFTFDPALEVSPGETASFTLSAQLAAESVATGSHWLNTAQASAGAAATSSASVLALLLLLATTALLPRRWALGMVVALGLLAGCHDDDPGPPAPAPQSRVSAVTLNTVGAVTQSGGSVSYSGLPASLGTVTLRP